MADAKEVPSGWKLIEDQSFLETVGGVLWREHKGLIEVALQAEARHRNVSGVVHGGVFMTLIDRCLGMSARHLADYRRMATASMTVNFLRPALVGDFLEVSCTISKNGRKSAFGEAVVTANGKVCCTATGVFMTVEG